MLQIQSDGATFTETKLSVFTMMDCIFEESFIPCTEIWSLKVKMCSLSSFWISLKSSDPLCSLHRMTCNYALASNLSQANYLCGHSFSLISHWEQRTLDCKSKVHWQGPHWFKKDLLLCTLFQLFPLKLFLLALIILLFSWGFVRFMVL